MNLLLFNLFYRLFEVYETEPDFFLVMQLYVLSDKFQIKEVTVRLQQC